MSLNSTDAFAVNTLLTWLTGRHPYPSPGVPLPDDLEAYKAASLLAGHADAQLHAGWTDDDVARAWPGVLRSQAALAAAAAAVLTAWDDHAAGQPDSYGPFIQALAQLRDRLGGGQPAARVVAADD
jgi:hypothetical protein